MSLLFQRKQQKVFAANDKNLNSKEKIKFENFPVHKDFSGKISGDINRNEFLYRLMKCANIWES